MELSACSVPVVPMRSEPSHRSEMVSQLLFGEKVVILEEVDDKWKKVQSKYDGYKGWVQAGQLLPINQEKYDKPDILLTPEWVNEIDFNGYKMGVPMGCSLTAFGNRITMWNKNTVKFKGELWNTKEVKFNEKLLRKTTFKFLNTPYLWGGKSVFGIDCSGFVQTILKLFDVKVPRDSSKQAECGETVGFLQSAKCGDIAFFDNEEGNIIHVGILLNTKEIIHSSSKVRLDKIDIQGIINQETKKRTHHLRVIKRFF